MIQIPPDQIWMMVVGFLLAFVLAFGLGANDVANTFGSSVGSGVLTLKQACVLATICEISGAFLLGSKVSSTVRKGIVDTTLFEELENGPTTLMLGQIAALGGSCIWMLIATFFRLPVSGTHSIVGATMGFSMVVFGVRAINWIGVLKIVASWFISPVLSGLLSVGTFVVIHYLVLIQDEPLEPALRLLPAFYGIITVINLISILLGGSNIFQFNQIPLYGVFILGCGVGMIVILCVKIFLLPYLRNRILAENNTGPTLSNKLYTTFRGRQMSNIMGKFKRKLSRSNDPARMESNGNSGLIQTSLATLPEVEFTPDSKKMSSDLHLVAVNPSGDSDPVEAMYKTHHVTATQHVPYFPTRSVSRTFDVTPTDTNPINQLNGTSIRSANIHHIDISDHYLSVSKRSVLAQPCLPAIGEEEADVRETIKDRPAEAKVFWFLQILTAVFGSFAHGGNDVSNAIGPLMGLWIIGVTQEVSSKMPNPHWILLYGGIGISVGLCVWGRRVIQTLGEDLTRITPSSGVCIELSSAFTVLFASKLGLPISTTHCQVGSVIFVGRFRSRDNVNWSIFRNIIIAWVVTVPVACVISALLMYLLMFSL